MISFQYYTNLRKNTVINWKIDSLYNSPDYFDKDFILYKLKTFNLTEKLPIQGVGDKIKIKLQVSLAEIFYKNPWLLMQSNETWGEFYYNNEPVTEFPADFTLFNNLDFLHTNVAQLIKNYGFFVPVTYKTTENGEENEKANFLLGYLGFDQYALGWIEYNESLVIGGVNATHQSRITVTNDGDTNGIRILNNGTVIIPHFNSTNWEKIVYRYEFEYGGKDGILHEFIAILEHTRTIEYGEAHSTIFLRFSLQNVLNTYVLSGVLSITVIIIIPSVIFWWRRRLKK